LQDMIFTLQLKLEHQNQPIAPLPNEITSCLLPLFKDAPHVGEPIFSFCNALLVQLLSENVEMKEALQVEITMPLTEEQQQGQQLLMELPGIASELGVRHLPALMGFCWAQKPVIHSSVDQSPTEECRQAIEEGMRWLDRPQDHPEWPSLLVSLRFFGMTLFAVEQTPEFLSATMANYLDRSIFDHEELLQRLPEEHPLASIPVQFFGTIYRVAEKLWSTVEFCQTAQMPLKVIPFAAVRPFLRSQRVTQRQEGILPLHPHRAADEMPQEKLNRTLSTTPASAQGKIDQMDKIVWEVVDKLEF